MLTLGPFGELVAAKMLVKHELCSKRYHSICSWGCYSRSWVWHDERTYLHQRGDCLFPTNLRALERFVHRG